MIAINVNQDKNTTPQDGNTTKEIETYRKNHEISRAAVCGAASGVISPAVGLTVHYVVTKFLESAGVDDVTKEAFGIGLAILSTRLISNCFRRLAKATG